ncbi:hypothetical protein FA15DRAFT_371475 [Coprinopsis marcescibilis]|uniref:Ubiquitin-like domain-containing protein n=1 Tax=Coprinopsis marcescibilis TaxID=230819 RepID=A0A5C3KAS5_COPMA|nr:hypothetical protein FA15DRAFT_371475 [Coprinopsis marcescibilis]
MECPAVTQGADETSETTDLARQVAVQLFAGASNLSITGGTFNAIGRDMIVNYQNNPAETLSLLLEAQRLMQELQRVQATVPTGVRFGNANAVTITDALGETFTLPWNLIPSHEDMHDIIRRYFRGRIGEADVADQRYRLLPPDQPEVNVMNSWNYGRFVRPGSELVMSMRVRKPLEGPRDLCPDCGQTDLGTYTSDGWTVCRRCNKRFKTTVSIVYIGKLGDPLPTHLPYFRHVHQECCRYPTEDEWESF